MMTKRTMHKAGIAGVLLIAAVLWCATACYAGGLPPKGGGAAKAAKTAGATPSAAKGATLDNLMKAFNGESNANARYLAFAKKADEEGYGAAASLFRTAAAAEQIHFTKEGAIIKKLGGTPKADIKKPEVKSTKENLEAALKGETYEHDTMYPEFVAAAEKEGQKDAVEAFTEAKGAEGAHAKLYQTALADLDKWKGGAKDFFLCPECGNITPELTFEKCPVCATPKDKFKKMS